MTRYRVVQDGSSFDLFDADDERVDTITAPRRAWYDSRRDSQTRQEVEVLCRSWFLHEYCPPRRIEAVFGSL